MILKLLQKLDSDISYWHGYYYNNPFISNLYQNFSYNDLLDWYWKPFYSTKKLKKIYLKNKLELERAKQNHDKIVNMGTQLRKLVNWYFTNI